MIKGLIKPMWASLGFSDQVRSTGWDTAWQHHGSCSVAGWRMATGRGGRKRMIFLAGETGIRLLEQLGLLSMKMMERCYGGRSRRRRGRARSSANIAGYF